MDTNSSDLIQMREGLIRYLKTQYPGSDPSQLLLMAASIDSSPSSDIPSTEQPHDIIMAHIDSSSCDGLANTLRALVQGEKAKSAEGFLQLRLPDDQIRATSNNSDHMVLDRGRVHPQKLVATSNPGILRNKQEPGVVLGDDNVIRSQKPLGQTRPDTGLSLDELFRDTFDKASMSCGDYLTVASHQADRRLQLGLPANSPLQPGSRLLTTKHHYPGIHSPYAYISLQSAARPESITFFTMHREDFGLHSANLLYTGAAKLWLIVWPDYRERLERKIREFANLEGTRLCSQFIRHEEMMLHPDTLRAWDIKFSFVLQEPGMIVITMPNSYHQGFNLGPNQAEAINLALENDWQVDSFYVDCSIHRRSRKEDPPMLVQGMSMLPESRPLNVEDPDQDAEPRKPKQHGPRSSLRRTRSHQQKMRAKRHLHRAIGKTGTARGPHKQSTLAATSDFQARSSPSPEEDLQEADVVTADQEPVTLDPVVVSIRSLSAFYNYEGDSRNLAISEIDTQPYVEKLRRFSNDWAQVYEEGLRKYSISKADAIRILSMVHVIGSPEVFGGLKGLIAAKRNKLTDGKTARTSFLNFGLLEASRSRLELQSRLAAYKLYVEYQRLEKAHRERTRKTRVLRNDRTIERGPPGSGVATMAYRDLFRSIYSVQPIEESDKKKLRAIRNVCHKGKAFSHLAEALPRHVLMLLPQTSIASPLMQSMPISLKEFMELRGPQLEFFISSLRDLRPRLALYQDLQGVLEEIFGLEDHSLLVKSYFDLEGTDIEKIRHEPLDSDKLVSLLHLIS